MELGGVTPTKLTQEVQPKDLSMGGVTKPTTSGTKTPYFGGAKQTIKK